jgi:hypothetical protein
VSHGAHPDGSPLGIPAKEETKQARIKAHNILEEYRKLTNYSRNRTYRELCRLMGVSRKDGYIGRFSTTDCNRLIDLLCDEMDQLRNADK